MPRKRTSAEVTLAEHTKRIGALGGKARAANMTQAERQESARIAADARAKKLTKKQRSEIARKAAAARWSK
jgi:hypothetical protein